MFDFDGTLSDSLEANLEAFQGVAEEFGFPPVTLQQFLDWYSPNWYVVYERMGLPADSWERADEVWLRCYDRGKVRLFSDSVRVLERLRLLGFKVGLVTGGSRGRVESELRSMGIHALFDVIVYGSDVAKEDLKPMPTQIRMALRLLREKADEALYVGDTPIDVLAGKKAGVLTAATTRGFSSVRRLREAEPDYIVDNLTQLLDIIAGASERLY